MKQLKKIFKKDEFGDSPFWYAVSAFSIALFVWVLLSMPSH